jgi:tripartite-type tricarboxylate transporter receptor subunit TctC
MHKLFSHGQDALGAKKKRGTVTCALTSAAIGVGLLLGMVHHAAAQNFPTKPVRIIVASGGSDTAARVLAPELGKIWGQGVVVDIRSGASGLISLEGVKQGAPDGYTLGLPTLSQMLSTLEHNRLLLASEFEGVTFVGSTPFAIAISPNVPAKSVEEFIAYAKARPGKLAYGSSGLWASSHVCMEEFTSRAGLNMLHVPYKNSQSGMTALLGDEVQVYCSAAANSLALAKAGKITLLGSSYKEPSDLLPGIPPIANKLPGYEVQGWYGLVTTLGTPKNLVARISADSVKAINTREMQEAFAKLGIRPEGTTPEKFSAFLRDESERWGRILRAAPKS